MTGLGFVSPRAAERRAAAQRYRDFKEARYLEGPRLNEDKSWIIVPSPWENRALIKLLKAKGFKYWGGDDANWSRSTSEASGQAECTPEQWLEWATEAYAICWLDWAEERGEAE